MSISVLESDLMFISDLFSISGLNLMSILFLIFDLMSGSVLVLILISLSDLILGLISVSDLSLMSILELLSDFMV